MHTNDGNLYIAQTANGPVNMTKTMLNRHGIIAGATGTGKTTSLQVIAETFAQAGIPCFMADIKGDLSGIAQPGHSTPFIEKRCQEFGINNPEYSACPTCFFDFYGEKGIPLRTTISELGPDMLARLLELNETQTNLLYIAFKIADDHQLLLIDIKDLNALLDYIASNGKDFQADYGTISKLSLGVIQRNILRLEREGFGKLFGEPSFDVHDFIRQENGKGVLNILAADKLFMNPKLYSTLLLWLLSELYTQLPEIGDTTAPKIVFFFDEAHTLFRDTPRAFVNKIEQIVRLIRSKGVGIFFVSQYPSDLPNEILGQLGNRIQHAMRAVTQKDQKEVRALAQTFRTNSELDVESIITQLSTGEVLLSILDENGSPTPVEQAKILFPLSQIGPVEPAVRDSLIKNNPLYNRYFNEVDPESAFEILKEQRQNDALEEKLKNEEIENRKRAKEEEKQNKKDGRRTSLFDKILTSATSTIGRQIGNKIVRSLLGSIFK